MTLNRILTHACAIGAVAALSAWAPVQAQTAAGGYPSHPVRLLVGFAAGGGSDVVARLIAQPLGERLGQSVVVENRPGAGGNIASSAVAKSAPDGYTLVLMTSGHTSNAAMRSDLPFDPVKDFEWISTVTTYPITLAVAPNSPLKSFDDFVNTVKTKPNSLTYSSVGVGTAMHLVGEWIMAETGGSALHVPFKGGSAPITELLAGRVDVMIDTMTNSAPLHKSGRARLLATTAAKGVQPLPGVASVADFYPNVVFESWLGVAAPAGTPPEVVARLNKEIAAVLAMPEVRKQLEDWGGSPTASSPGAFKSRIEDNIQRLKTIVSERNIKTE